MSLSDKIFRYMTRSAGKSGAPIPEAIHKKHVKEFIKELKIRRCECSTERGVCQSCEDFSELVGDKLI